MSRAWLLGLVGASANSRLKLREKAVKCIKLKGTGGGGCDYESLIQKQQQRGSLSAS